MSDKFDVSVKIKGITLAQSLALEDLFATWQYLGNIGGSRWTAFYSDGDGDFRPTILYNNNKPRHKALDLLGKNDVFWKGNEYRIDFDAIAWKLHNNPETKKEIRYLKMNPLKVLFRKIRNLMDAIKKDIRRRGNRRKWKKEKSVCQQNGDNPEQEQPKSQKQNILSS